jgi:hypothetical protein
MWFGFLFVLTLTPITIAFSCSDLKIRPQHKLFEVSKTVALAVGKHILVRDSIGEFNGYWRATVIDVAVDTVVVSYAPDVDEQIRGRDVVPRGDIVGVIINDGTLRLR